MKEQIIEIMSRVFGKPVTNDTTKENTPAWDSMSHLNLMIELETEFGVVLEPDEMTQMTTVEKIEQVIKSK